MDGRVVFIGLSSWFVGRVTVWHRHILRLRSGVKLLRRQGPGKTRLHIPDVVQRLGLGSAEGLLHALRRLLDRVRAHQRVAVLPSAQILVKDRVKTGAFIGHRPSRLLGLRRGGRGLLPVLVLYGAVLFPGQIARSNVGRIAAPVDHGGFLLRQGFLPLGRRNGMGIFHRRDVFLREILPALGAAGLAAVAPDGVGPPTQKIYQPVGHKAAHRQTDHQKFPVALKKGKCAAAVFTVQRSPDLTDQQPDPTQQQRQNGIGKAVHSPAPFPKNYLVRSVTLALEGVAVQVRVSGSSASSTSMTGRAYSPTVRPEAST